MRKKFSTLLALIMGGCCLSTNLFTATNSISINNARLIAQNHIFLCKETVDVARQYWGNIKLGEELTLYDLEDEPSAYAFYLETEDGQSQGYVIVNACQDNAPIIEYSYEGIPVFDLSEDQASNIAEGSAGDYKILNVSDDFNHTTSTSLNVEFKDDIDFKNPRVYYLGGLTYINEYSVQDNDPIFIDVDARSIIEQPIEQIEAKTELYSTLSNNEYASSWENLSKLCTSEVDYVSDKVRASDGYLEDDDIFPSDDVDYSHTGQTLAGTKYHTFMTENDISKYSYGNGFCAPLAGTNLCMLLYINTVKYHEYEYENLFKGSWQSVFRNMYGKMQTDKVTGTTTNNMIDGLTSYFSEAGYSIEIQGEGGVEYSRVRDCIKYENMPIILNVYNHEVYKNHTMLGTGYDRFTFKNDGTKILYIEVRDAYSSKARYVNASIGENSDFATFTVLPK